MNDNKPCVQIINLQLDLSGKPIYRNLNLQIQTGTLTALTGKNPAAWNILLRMIAGTQGIQNGMIDLWGVPVNQIGRRGLSHLICYVPRLQQPLFAYPVTEFIMQGCESRLKPMQAPQDSDRALADSIIRQLKIEKLVHRDCSLLNKAERQLVLLARALMQDARLLMLDDPVSYLPEKEQYAVLSLLLDMTRRQDKTMVVALDDPWLGLQLADQMVVFDEQNLAAILYRQQPDFAAAAESVLHRVLPLDAECHLLDAMPRPGSQTTVPAAAPVDAEIGKTPPKSGFLF